MSVPTVYMVGADRLALVPEYLNLGSIVVIAPDRDTLKVWEDGAEPAPTPTAVPGVVVDLPGHRIVHDGASLPLSDLEFRVLGALLAEPGRAWSFRELLHVGWQHGRELPGDRGAVKALVQRLRAKLAVARAPVTIVAVRGFGFRVQATSERGGLRSVGTA